MKFLDVDSADTKQEALRPTSAASRAARVGGAKVGGVSQTREVSAVGGVSEQDYVSLLMSSPLFQQISDLESLLEKQTGTTSSLITGLLRNHVVRFHAVTKCRGAS